MAQIHNSEIIKGLSNTAGIQTAFENPPNQLAEKIVPVMEVNPKLLRNSTVLAAPAAKTTTSSGVVVLAAQADKDVYITGIQVTNSQDATCDNTSTTIALRQNGATINFYKNAKNTTTAGSFNHYLQYNPPLLIDRNTVIDYNHTFTAGASSISIVLYGYMVDVVKA